MSMQQQFIFSSVDHWQLEKTEHGITSPLGLFLCYGSLRLSISQRAFSGIKLCLSKTGIIPVVLLVLCVTSMIIQSILWGMRVISLIIV